MALRRSRRSAKKATKDATASSKTDNTSSKVGGQPPEEDSLLVHPDVVGVASRLGILKESIKCRICLEMLKNPASLSCGHYFCKKCISTYVSHETKNGVMNVCCPLCGHSGVSRRSIQVVNKSSKTFIKCVDKLERAIVDATKHVFDFTKVAEKPKCREAPTPEASKECKLSPRNIFDESSEDVLNSQDPPVHPSIWDLNREERTNVKTYMANKKDDENLEAEEKQERKEAEEDPVLNTGFDFFPSLDDMVEAAKSKDEVINRWLDTSVSNPLSPSLSECSLETQPFAPSKAMGEIPEPSDIPSDKTEGETAACNLPKESSNPSESKSPDKIKGSMVKFEIKGKLQPTEKLSPESPVRKRVPFVQLGLLAQPNIQTFRDHYLKGVPSFDQVLEKRRQRLERLQSSPSTKRKREENFESPQSTTDVLSSTTVDDDSPKRKRFRFKSTSKLSLSNVKKLAVESMEVVDPEPEKATVDLASVSIIAKPNTIAESTSDDDEVSTQEMQMRLEHLQNTVKNSDLMSKRKDTPTSEKDTVILRKQSEEKSCNSSDNESDDLFGPTPQDMAKLSRTRPLSFAKSTRAKRSLAYDEGEETMLNQILDKMQVNIFSNFEFHLYGHFAPTTKRNRIGKTELIKIIEAGGGTIVKSVNIMSFRNDILSLCLVDVTHDESKKFELREEYFRIFSCSSVAVVSKEWLLTCAKASKLMRLQNYVQHDCDTKALKDADYPNYII